jgi:predicted DNA-binding transcriptional regulator YafY
MQTFLRRLEILNFLKSRHLATGTEEIIQHLADAGYIDAQELKTKSQYRLIQRDLKFLLGDEIDEDEFDNEFGLVIERGLGKSNMWRLDPYSLLSYSFEKMPDYMALALSITQKHLKQVLPSDTQNVLKSIFQDAQQKLIKQEKAIAPKHYQRLTRAVEFFQRGQQLKAADFDLSLLNRIYSAILHRKRIHLTYQSQGKQKEYELHPFGVVIMLPKIYLIAKKEGDMSQGDEAFRSFLIHKIEDLQLSKQANEVPDDFELKHYLDQGNMDVLVDFNDTKSYALEISITAYEYSNLLLDLRDNPISDDQSLTQLSENEWRLCASSKRTVQLRNWLLSLGSQATVLSPDIIRQDLLNHLEQVWANYKN